MLEKLKLNCQLFYSLQFALIVSVFAGTSLLITADGSLKMPEVMYGLIVSVFLTSFLFYYHLLSDSEASNARICYLISLMVLVSIFCTSLFVSFLLSLSLGDYTSSDIGLQGSNSIIGFILQMLMFTHFFTLACFVSGGWILIPVSILVAYIVRRFQLKGCINKKPQ